MFGDYCKLFISGNLPRSSDCQIDVIKVLSLIVFFHTFKFTSNNKYEYIKNELNYHLFALKNKNPFDFDL